MAPRSNGPSSVSGRVPLLVGCLAAAGVGALVPGKLNGLPLVVVGIVAGVFCLRARLPTLGYALFVATLLTRVRIPYVPLLPEQALLLLVIGVLLVRGRLDVIIHATRLLPASAWLFVLWGGLVSVIRAPDGIASLRILGWIAGSLMIASLVAVLSTGRGTQITQAVARLSSIVSLAALVGVLAWLAASASPASTLGVQVEGLTGAPAAYGLSFEANIFGGICAVWLVLDVLYVHRARLASSVVIRGLLGLGVLASLTRAAALGALLGIAVGAVATQRTRRVAASVLLMTGLTVGGIFLVGPTVPILRPIAEKGAQLVDLNSSTSVVRRASWDLALGDMSFGTTLTGQGVNSFGQRHVDPSRPSERVPGYLSNVFLQVIYDTGVVGAALLVAAAWAIVKRLRSADVRVLGLAVCGAIVGAATSPLWFANWWVVVGLAAMAGREHRASGSRVLRTPSLRVATVRTARTGRPVGQAPERIFPIASDR